METDKCAAAIATWNLAWAKPGSSALTTMLSRLKTHNSDIVCFTECYTDGVPNNGYVITGEPDWGYASHPERRKVLLWSKSPWSRVDQLGHSEMPSGRFISAETETPLGKLKVIGVCIPWRDAHVRTGRSDREPWEDHLGYLSSLGRILQDQPERTVLLGDFNQRVPRRWTPKKVHHSLLASLNHKFNIVTGGLLQPVDAQAIDHIAVSSDLKSEAIVTISNTSEDNRKLSDHFGVTARVYPSKDGY